ncbi:TonB-dependent siderophore receptor [plant metagenome]|uniref:TonB-dependent siderophore receptor n=1 Tax=plant metagenome TaxID=1297885 RepID=A0A484U367_9ZZZZ
MVDKQAVSAASKSAGATFVGLNALALSIILALAAAPQRVQAQEAPVSISIHAQPLDAALEKLGEQAGIQIFYLPETVRGLNAPSVSGSLTADEALRRLLAGTDIVFRRTGKNVSLSPPPSNGIAELAPVMVRGYLEPATEGTGSYTTGVVTIGKGQQTLKEIPQSVTVVTRQKMDDQNLSTLEEVLANSTGITLYESPMGGSYVHSRGFLVDTYQFDGVNRAFYYAQANSFSSNTAILDRVEIVRGATGMLQGAGSPSAAINLVRKRPLDEKKLDLAVSGGSWNNYRTDIDATGPLNEAGTLRGRGVASYNDREYFYDTAKSRTGVLYGVLEYDLGPDTLLTGGISYEELRSTPFFAGLPRYGTGADIGLRRSTSLGPAWNRWNSKQTAVFAELLHDFDSDWRAKLTVNSTREWQDVKYAYSLGAVNPDTLTGPALVGALFDFSTRNNGIDLNVDGAFQALGRKHSVSLGASVNHMVSKSDFSLAMLGVPVNVFNPNPAIAEPADAWMKENSYLGDATIFKRKQSSVYGVTRLSLAEPLTLVAGSRLTWYEEDSRYRDSGEPYTDPYKENAVLTPYGGLIYALDPAWSAYVSYADIFEPQNALDAAGKTLDPIKGENYELGLKGELLGGKANASFALFRVDQTNRAQENFSNTCTASEYCYVSSGKVRSQGFEAEISGELARGWQVFAGYTFNTFKYLNDTADAGTGFASTYTPKHMFRAWMDYRLPGSLAAWNLGGGVNFQTGSYRVAQGMRIEQPSYAVWSARIGYQVNRNWSAALNVNNLFDKTYYQTIGAPGWGNFYGEPRSAMLTLRGTF